MEGIEPEYVDAGDEFDAEYVPRIPKWRLASTDLQKRLLDAAGRTYWPEGAEGKTLRGKFIAVEKAMMPMKSGVVSDWPTEWVEHCLKWYEGKKRTFVNPVPLKGFFTFLYDKDKKTTFVVRALDGSASARPGDFFYDE